MTVKIPALVRRFVATAPSRTNLYGVVIRAVTVQSMTRRLRRLEMPLARIVEVVAAPDPQAAARVLDEF